ncbi:MAG: Choice-of-anchor protein, partial [Bacteroidetes bacterium]|nr:Choice-of-anchor protein [Bacteroidota bacterium]
GTRRFGVTFGPTVIGLLNANIIFTHSGPTLRDTVRVSGVGVAPGLLVVPRPVSFGAVGLGSNLVDTVKLFNSGSASLRVDSARVRGPHASDFAIVGSSGPFLLSPSDSISLTIRFTPLDSALRSAVLIIISNAASSPDSVPMTGRGRASLISVTLTGDTTAGNPLNISATPPANSVVDSAKLYFRNAGKQAYDSLRLTQSGSIYVGSFPANIINARGIEYYVVFFTNQGQSKFPENNPEANPAVVRVKVVNLQSSLVLKRRVYKMISIPLELNDPSVGGVLFDDYNPYDRSRWRLFRWEGGNYVEHPAISGMFTPGTAFWLITQSGFGFDADNGRSVNSALPSQITIPVGWSQIACPFIFPVAWDIVVNSQSVQGPFYYDNGQYTPNVRVLRPWEGYFVWNDSSQPITISVPPVEAPPTLTQFNEQRLLHTANDFILKLSATTEEGLNDSYNYVGFVDGAGAGRDNIDIAEPPMIGDFVSLSIMQENARYVGDFKPRGEAGQRWDMEVMSTLNRPPVHVQMQQFGRLPDGFGVYVLDQDDFSALGISNNHFSMQLGEAGTVRRLVVIIGTEQYARDNSNGIPLVPIEYALNQNYPNPFNPATTIGYQLNKRGEVKLEIYNLLGQRVRTLVDAEQVTGVYSVEWDGRNGLGLNAASGVYIYRLRSGEFTASKKLLLLR